MYRDKVFSGKIDLGRLNEFANFISPFVICNPAYPLGPVNCASIDGYFEVFESSGCHLDAEVEEDQH